MGLSSKAILRFRREAEAAGKLHHTNIVPIYTTGEDKGIHFYAMELIDGPSLDKVIKERKHAEIKDEPLAETAAQFCRSGGNENREELKHVDGARKAEERNSDSGARKSTTASISTTSGTTYFDEVATMIADVAEALDHAHEHGVIHRDVKPSNLLLGPDGRLSINDFGLARMLEQPGMTVSGEFVGSPLYMSPEQITAGRVQLDHRTDIYSLGATLYELLTHQPPFPGQSRDQVLSQILHKEPLSTRKVNRKVPIDLDTICMKAIDKDPDRRYQTATLFAEDLRKFVNRYAISARRVSVTSEMRKFVRRNKVASSAVLSALSILAVFVSLSLYQRRLDRLEMLGGVIDMIYETVLTNQDEKVRPLVDQAEKLGATPEQMHLLRGLEESSRKDHIGAIESFEELPQNLVARSLIAHEKFLSGTEVEYMRALSELTDEKPATFEEKLFLGIANVWGNPRRAYNELKALNNERPGLEYVKTQLARAASYLATLVLQNLDKSEQLLNEAYDLTGASRSEVTDIQEATRLLVLVDQAALFNARAKLAKIERERFLYEAKLVSKSDELTKYLDASILNLAKSTEYRAFSICHALRFLGRDEELATVATRWKNQQVPLRPYTSHLLATHFASRGDFNEARFWFQRVSNSGEEFSATQFLLALIDALDSQSERAIADIRLEMRSECERKSRTPEASGLLFFDALVLYLLGDDEFLQNIEKDALMTQIQSPRNLAPIINYFKIENRVAADSLRLLRESEQTSSPTLSTMHAHFALGVEALVRGHQQEARSHFEVCANGRQYIWYVNRLSEVLLNHQGTWQRFSRKTTPSNVD
ncbi:MAG TPA: hypothetical protein DDW52_19930 [Planctomycetaceae bacterium]|nr:hypothetical protein [Planctomycetaceae bacterium]